MVKFYSRNSHNYTHVYGPKMAPVILENLDVQAAVLDGEMIVWDTEN
jgi:ATP-dependent DNA ligase